MSLITLIFTKTVLLVAKENVFDPKSSKDKEMMENKYVMQAEQFAHA